MVACHLGAIEQLDRHLDCLACMLWAASCICCIKKLGMLGLTKFVHLGSNG